MTAAAQADLQARKDSSGKPRRWKKCPTAEWESLCDGCARCCLEKLEDEDTGKIYFTHVACKLLDAGPCACKDYPNRSDQGSRLRPADARTMSAP